MKKIIILYVHSHTKNVIEYTREFVSQVEQHQSNNTNVIFMQYCPDIEEFYCNDLNTETIERIKKYLKTVIDVHHKSTVPQLITMLFRNDNLITTFTSPLFEYGKLEEEINELLSFEID